MKEKIHTEQGEGEKVKEQRRGGEIEVKDERVGVCWVDW